MEVFSATDVKGALRNLTDEIPKLEATHTRAINHFKDVDISDLEKCISLLKDDLKRQQFEIDFRSFSKQMEVVLPDKAASPFIKDLKSRAPTNIIMIDCPMSGASNGRLTGILHSVIP